MITSFKEFLTNSHHIAVVSHRHPDGDALGSSLALAEVCQLLGTKATVVNASIVDDQKFSFLEGISSIKKQIPPSCDGIVMVDCSTQERTGLQFPLGVRVIVVDHHVSAVVCDPLDIVDPLCCSTTFLLYRVFEQWGVVPSRKVATALYAGLVEDTLFFTHRVNEDVFDFASQLCRYGVDPSRVVGAMKRGSLAKVRLWGEALRGVELMCSGRIAFVALPYEIFASTGATLYDADGIADELMQLPTVDVVVLARWDEGEKVKVSLRSCGTDILSIAHSFGGGGHEHSAGFEIIREESINPYESLKQIIKERI